MSASTNAYSDTELPSSRQMDARVAYCLTNSAIAINATMTSAQRAIRM